MSGDGRYVRQVTTRGNNYYTPPGRATSTDALKAPAESAVAARAPLW